MEDHTEHEDTRFGGDEAIAPVRARRTRRRTSLSDKQLAILDMIK